MRWVTHEQSLAPCLVHGREEISKAIVILTIWFFVLFLMEKSRAVSKGATAFTNWGGKRSKQDKWWRIFIRQEEEQILVLF